MKYRYPKSINTPAAKKDWRRLKRKIATQGEQIQYLRETFDATSLMLKDLGAAFHRGDAPAVGRKFHEIVFNESKS